MMTVCSIAGGSARKAGGSGGAASGHNTIIPAGRVGKAFRTAPESIRNRPQHRHPNRTQIDPEAVLNNRHVAVSATVLHKTDHDSLRPPQLRFHLSNKSAFCRSLKSGQRHAYRPTDGDGRERKGGGNERKGMECGSGRGDGEVAAAAGAPRLLICHLYNFRPLPLLGMRIQL